MLMLIISGLSQNSSKMKKEVVLRKRTVFEHRKAMHSDKHRVQNLMTSNNLSNVLGENILFNCYKRSLPK